MKYEMIEVPLTVPGRNGGPDRTETAMVDYEDHYDWITLKMSKELLMTIAPEDFGKIFEGFLTQFQSRNRRWFQ